MKHSNIFKKKMTPFWAIIIVVVFCCVGFYLLELFGLTTGQKYGILFSVYCVLVSFLFSRAIMPSASGRIYFRLVIFPSAAIIFFLIILLGSIIVEFSK